MACRQLLATVQKKANIFLHGTVNKSFSHSRGLDSGSHHRPFLLEILHICRRLSTCIRNYIGKVMNILLQSFLVFWWHQITPRDSRVLQWQILETSRALYTIPYPSQLWPSNIENSCSLHWFLPSPVQYMLSSIYSLLTQSFPLHFSEIRRGSALGWTWETALHKINVLSVTVARSRCQRKS